MGGGEDEGFVGEEDPGPKYLSIAEIVSELLYAGKSLSEIAGYDALVLKWVVFRKRNKYGALVQAHDELPPGVEVDDDGMRIISNPVPFSAMFRQVKKRQGLNKEQTEAQWQEWLLVNPQFERLRRGG